MTAPSDSMISRPDLGPAYRGRFAPSPTGNLHFGSLIAAVASYCDAKAHQGQWLLRIEDLDPPREQPGAADSILRTLEAFGLYWDLSVVYQSQQQALYQARLEQLIEQGQVYACQCSRKQIKQSGGIYTGQCQNKQLPLDGPYALRLIQHSPAPTFAEYIQSPLELASEQMTEDFVIRRKDNLFAYQLAVVCDDIEQKINCIVRGADLLDSTPKQVRLYQLFNQSAPDYLHIPLAVDNNGSKLSKQNYAPAINAKYASGQLYQALVFLGQAPEPQLAQEPSDIILNWAVTHWNYRLIPRQLQCQY